MRTHSSWVPAAILVAGAVLVRGAGHQRAMTLREPLNVAVPRQIAGMTGEDRAISRDEQEVAGMSSYVMRAFTNGAVPAFSLYVGYYESQTQGRTIHSPRNCLPGAGWEALSSSVIPIATPAGTVMVNRTLVQNHNERALVLYWYQGRGRIESNEYKVKWQLLRDAALKGRTEEALVRIIVPIQTTEAESVDLATRAAAEVVPAVYHALPNA